MASSTIHNPSIKSVSFTGTVPSKSSGAYWDVTCSGSIPSGYTPVGITTVNTGSSMLAISGAYLNANGYPFIYGRTLGAQSTAANVRVDVVYIKL